LINSLPGASAQRMIDKAKSMTILAKAQREGAK
jgi:hypothetical protein